MIKTCFFLVFSFILLSGSYAQDKFYSKSARLNFSASGGHDVSASSRTGTVVYDSKSGALDISILVKSFEFAKAGMQDKFNKSILETDQFPKAEFKGSVENPSSVQLNKSGIYTVVVKGKLTMHGVTKDITANATFATEGSALIARSKFTISLADYNITNPGIGTGNIDIVVECQLEPLKN